MRKIVLSLHTTLDGFVAGPNGEMDWIKLDDSLFDFVNVFTAEADMALYGRKTFEMMDGYWPTAGDQPDASKHDREHSRWYNKVDKIVLSTTMTGKKDKVIVLRDNIMAQVSAIKQQAGKNILIFGSPTAAHTLMHHNLIDEYWLFVNPVLLGNGIPVFASIKDRTDLQLTTTKVFPCGVVALHHIVN